jgi:hypothetical protein
MISMLANHRTRGIEVSRGHSKETQAIMFPPHTSRNEVSFLDQAGQSGWIDDITPEQHHRRGMLIYFSKYLSNNFDDIAREVCNLKKRTHTMETYTTESMLQNCSLTGQQFKEIIETLLARSNVFMALNVKKLKELEKGPEPFFKVYKYCTQGKDPEKVKLWTTDVSDEIKYAIDQRYCEMIEESNSKGLKKHRRNTAKQLSKNLPSLDYDGTLGIPCGSLNLEP